MIFGFQEGSESDEKSKKNDGVRDIAKKTNLRATLVHVGGQVGDQVGGKLVQKSSCKSRSKMYGKMSRNCGF